MRLEAGYQQIRISSLSYRNTMVVLFSSLVMYVLLDVRSYALCETENQLHARMRMRGTDRMSACRQKRK